MGRARDLVERAWELIEGGAFERLGEVFRDDAELSTASAAGSGLEYVRGVFTRHMEAYPDLRHEVLDAVESADGGAIAVEMAFTGTHAGELRGAAGTIAPTGRVVRWRSSDQVRLRDGRISSWHAHFDRLAQRQQLGLEPASRTDR